MFKNYCSTYEGIFFIYTALLFFAVAAGYVCKTRLVQLKNLSFSVRKTIFKQALKIFNKTTAFVFYLLNS